MKKNFFTLIFFIFFLIFFLNTKAQVQQNPVFSVLCKYIDWIETLLLFLGIFSILFAGYKILTSTGEPSKLEESKKILLVVLVGMALIFGMKSFLNFVGLGAAMKCP